MLLNHLYSIERLDTTKEDINELEGTLLIDFKHPILNGHFPGRPIVPGVCLLTMVLDCLCQLKNREYALNSSSVIKFIHPVDPSVGQQISIKINVIMEDREGIELEASLFKENLVFLKLRGIYKQLV